MPCPALAVDLDVPARLLDEAVDHREPQPGALPRPFGGEERLEDARLRRGIHAEPRIGDRDLHVSACTHITLMRRVVLRLVRRCAFR